MRYVSFLSVFIVIAFGNATAASEENFVTCLAEVEDTARLACYDQAAMALKSAQNEQGTVSVAKNTAAVAAEDTKGQTASVIASATKGTAATQEDNFGLSEVARQKKNKVEGLREIKAKVAEIGFMARGELKVTLDNGQVWQQLSSDSVKVRIRSGVEYTATVKKASLGSHVLKLNKSKKLIRVRRIK